MKNLFILLMLVFLGNCAQGEKVQPSEKSEYTSCFSCGKYGVDVNALAQVNTRTRHRSTLIRGSHIFPGCQGVNEEFVCFISGKNLFCGAKKSLGVRTTNSTYFCSNYGGNGKR